PGNPAALPKQHERVAGNNAVLFRHDQGSARRAREAPEPAARDPVAPKHPLLEIRKGVDVGQGGRAKSDLGVGGAGEGGLHGNPIWVPSTALRKARPETCPDKPAAFTTSEAFTLRAHSKAFRLRRQAPRHAPSRRPDRPSGGAPTYIAMVLHNIRVPDKGAGRSSSAGAGAGRRWRGAPHSPSCNE